MRRRETDGERADGVGTKGRDEIAAERLRLPDRQLLAVQLPRGSDRRGEVNAHVVRAFAVGFHDADHDVIALFGFLQSHDAHAIVAGGENREALAERTGMLRRLKGDERLIEAQRLPAALLLPPIARVAGQTIDEAVVSPILRGLVAVRAAVA